MNDKVSLFCNFGSTSVLSPELDLYTCNARVFSPKYYPQDKVLVLGSNGDILFNIFDYVYANSTKPKCFLDKITL
jgi:hypothetical protein